MRLEGTLFCCRTSSSPYVNSDLHNKDGEVCEKGYVYPVITSFIQNREQNHAIVVYKTTIRLEITLFTRLDYEST